MVIREQLSKVYGSENFKKNYQGIFDNSKGFEQILHYLDKSINEQTLYEIAEKNNQEIKKDKITRVVDIDSITDTWTYTIAVLNNYGVGEEARRKRIDGLILSHFSEIKKEKAEGVALCYGYNRGYSAFTKDYGINERIPYKYKLQSRLDYYTIESVYQYVFNGVVSSTFLYLEDWCPCLPVKHPKNKTDYVILDEVIIGKKKAQVFSEEWWNGLFPRFLKKYAEFANPIFLFFQSIVEEIKDDLYEEQKGKEEVLQDKLNENINQINVLNELLKQKTKENDELQKQLNILSNPAHIPYSAEGRMTQTIASEPQIEYGLNNECFFIKSDLEHKTIKELQRIAKEYNVKVPNKAKKDEMIKLIINSIKPKDDDLFSQLNN